MASSGMAAGGRRSTHKRCREREHSTDVARDPERAVSLATDRERGSFEHGLDRFVARPLCDEKHGHVADKTEHSDANGSDQRSSIHRASVRRLLYTRGHLQT